MSDKTQPVDENEELKSESDSSTESEGLMSEQQPEGIFPEEEAESSDDLQKQLEEAQAKAEQNWDQAVRLQAELENLRRRSKMDLEKAHKFGLEKFADELLPVVDSLELGLAAATEEVSAEKLKEGTELTLKMLKGVLERFGISAVDPTGEAFNPEQHQAMTMQESDEHDSNTVIAVMQKGYTLNDRLIRPAMVIVSK